MAEQQRWFVGKPDYENWGLALASDTEAYAGHVGKALELTRRAVDSAIRADSKETGAIWRAIAAQEEAAYGNSSLSPADRGRGFGACSHKSGRGGRSRACICHGGRCSAGRVLGARPRQTLSAGHADAVTLVASDPSAIGDR